MDKKRINSSARKEVQEVWNRPEEILLKPKEKELSDLGPIPPS